MSSIRSEIVFKGHVQGVGFRWTATRIAEGLGIRGWVRNEPDGSVRMVAEGARGEIDRLLASIDDALPGHVDGQDCTFSAASGEFAGFRILSGESLR